MIQRELNNLYFTLNYSYWEKKKMGPGEGSDNTTTPLKKQTERKQYTIICVQCTCLALGRGAVYSFLGNRTTALSPASDDTGTCWRTLPFGNSESVLVTFSL